MLWSPLLLPINSTNFDVAWIFTNRTCGSRVLIALRLRLGPRARITRNATGFPVISVLRFLRPFFWKTHAILIWIFIVVFCSNWLLIHGLKLFLRLIPAGHSQWNVNPASATHWNSQFPLSKWHLENCLQVLPSSSRIKPGWQVQVFDWLSQ